MLKRKALSPMKDQKTEISPPWILEPGNIPSLLAHLFHLTLNLPLILPKLFLLCFLKSTKKQF